MPTPPDNQTFWVRVALAPETPTVYRWSIHFSTGDGSGSTTGDVSQSNIARGACGSTTTTPDLSNSVDTYKLDITWSSTPTPYTIPYGVGGATMCKPLTGVLYKDNIFFANVTFYDNTFNNSYGYSDHSSVFMSFEATPLVHTSFLQTLFRSIPYSQSGQDKYVDVTDSGTNVVGATYSINSLVVWQGGSYVSSTMRSLVTGVINVTGYVSGYGNKDGSVGISVNGTEVGFWANSSSNSGNFTASFPINAGDLLEFINSSFGSYAQRFDIFQTSSNVHLTLASVTTPTPTPNLVDPYCVSGAELPLYNGTYSKVTYNGALRWEKVGNSNYYFFYNGADSWSIRSSLSESAYYSMSGDASAPPLMGWVVMSPYTTVPTITVGACAPPSLNPCLAPANTNNGPFFFPTTRATNDIYSFAGRAWYWNSYAWHRYCMSTTPTPTPTPSPTVTSISPTSGSTAGGTSVTITGTNFTGATAVTIGGVAATNVTVVNSTTITATTPAHAAGTASVLVTTSGGTNTANTLFTYTVPAPALVNPYCVSGAGQTQANGTYTYKASINSGAGGWEKVGNPSIYFGYDSDSDRFLFIDTTDGYTYLYLGTPYQTNLANVTWSPTEESDQAPTMAAGECGSSPTP